MLHACYGVAPEAPIAPIASNASIALGALGAGSTLVAEGADALLCMACIIHYIA